MLVTLVLLAAAVLAAGTYLGVERLGRKAVVPIVLRTATYGATGLLIANVSCPRPPTATRPLALLDASLSMAQVDGGWSRAKAEAARLGDVRLVGAASPADSVPTGGRSLVASDVIAAAAGGRPVWLVTDGAVEDADEIPPDIRRRIGVAIVPHPAGADLAITRVEVPERVAAGDTLRLDLEVTGFGEPPRREVVVEVRSEGRRWLAGTLQAGPGTTSLHLQGPVPPVAAGPHLVEIALQDAGDADPRTDRRLAVITVTPTPGIVLVAAPGDWESRFLYRALLDVAALPVRGYLGLEGGQWRRMGDLAHVSATEVDQAAARADLLALVGDVPERIRRLRVRGRWDFVATRPSSAPAAGDWYLAPGGASPVSGAFVGLPIDSFPPAVALAAVPAGPGDWVGLTAQLNRRGLARPAVVGRDSAGRREMLVAVDGLWRWGFRGGASEEAYRAWVAAAASWLLGGTDSTTGAAHPIKSVVEQGRPLIFERTRPDSVPLPIELTTNGVRRSDTLRFDGAGRAELRLPPGGYGYRLAGGGTGMVAVEEFTDEWLSRPVTLSAHQPTGGLPPGREPLRDLPWLFGIAIAALSGEWWWRRRAGLR